MCVLALPVDLSLYIGIEELNYSRQILPDTLEVGLSGIGLPFVGLLEVGLSGIGLPFVGLLEVGLSGIG